MIFRNWNRCGFRYYHLWYMRSFSGSFPSCRATGYRNLTTFPCYPPFFSKKSAAVCNFLQVLSLCYEQNSSNCLSECGLSVYYNFNVLSNAMNFIALTPLMIRAGIQDGGLWIQCTVYVVKYHFNRLISRFRFSCWKYLKITSN